MARSNGTYHPGTPEYDPTPGIAQDFIEAASLEASRRPPDPTVAAREQQIAIVSHELRNSLAVVRGATKLLQSVSGADGIEGARTLIERHASHMARHIDDLLAQGRGDMQREDLQFARADLRRHVRHAADAILPECRRRAHQLLVTMPPEPVWVYADGERLEQALSNLLVNAAKYSADGGKIGIVLEHHDGSTFIRVTDSGIGISPALLPRIFDLYVQADASARDGRHGIGLAVVHDLIVRHGGSVTAASPGLGQGSEFTVTLPTI
jgi:signal transduction histidine kinase